jgi:hypothetical protein
MQSMRLFIHSGKDTFENAVEKNLTNATKQCDYACSDPSSFSRHLKMHGGKNHTNATMLPFKQAICGNI